MGVIYDRESALALYRACEAAVGEALSARECRATLKSAGASCSPKELDKVDHGRFSAADAQGIVHFLVPDKSCFRKSEKYAYSTWTAPLPNWSIRRLGDGVFVVSPEMLFFQMARRMHWAVLALLGMELCGNYLVEPLGRRREEPLTTPSRLVAFSRQLDGMPGIGTARKALRYILPNSWSPMESKCMLLLCLPRTVGGYGFPLPEFNVGVYVPRELRCSDGRERHYCDLYWERVRLDVEYDSNEAHEGPGAAVRDSQRAATLAALGIKVVSLRSGDVHNAMAFDGAARKIGVLLKVRQRSESKSMLEARIALRKLILFSESP